MFSFSLNFFFSLARLFDQQSRARELSTFETASNHVDVVAAVVNLASVIRPMASSSTEQKQNKLFGLLCLDHGARHEMQIKARLLFVSFAKELVALSGYESARIS